mmetsp:Transcript_28545/g.28881  ORF Transcript_28545/g.28881 Transcript_28545/m.28881 type:complete len:96 (-) Transcript_28545:238-525(-)
MPTSANISNNQHPIILPSPLLHDFSDYTSVATHLSPLQNYPSYGTLSVPIPKRLKLPNLCAKCNFPSLSQTHIVKTNNMCAMNIAVCNMKNGNFL